MQGRRACRRTDKTRDEAVQAYRRCCLSRCCWFCWEPAHPPHRVAPTSVPPTEAPSEAPTLHLDHRHSTIRLRHPGCRPPGSYRRPRYRSPFNCRAVHSARPAGPRSHCPARWTQPGSAPGKDTYAAGEAGRVEWFCATMARKSSLSTATGGQAGVLTLQDEQGQAPAPWPWTHLSLRAGTAYPPRTAPADAHRNPYPSASRT